MQQLHFSSDVLASMDGWKLWFVLLLPLCSCADGKVTVIKATGRGPDVTSVCARKDFLLATCRINTGRHQEDDCCLLHTGVERSECECDSRFSLTNKNHNVFLYLSSLTAADSGNYTCECSYERGTHVLHLSITVEADGEDGAVSRMRFLATVALITIAAATTFMSVAVTICGYILRRNHHRQNTSGAPDSTRSETLQSLDQGDTYTSLQHPDRDVYQCVSVSHPHHNAGFRSACTDTATIYTNSQAADGKEHDLNSVYAIYETI